MSLRAFVITFTWNYNQITSRLQAFFTINMYVRGKVMKTMTLTSSLLLLLNLNKWAISCNFSFPADEPDDRNCDSPREVRKAVVTPFVMCFFLKKMSSTCWFLKSVYNNACVCAGWDWEAAEEASPQSDFPGWRPVLHQQETEGRVAEPLEDGGGRESSLCLCEFIDQ